MTARVGQTAGRSRRSRRAVLALAVIALLSACGSASDQAAPLPSSASRTDGGAEPGGQAPTADAACPASGMRPRVGHQEAAMGLRVVTLEMANCSDADVVLRGYPELTFLDDVGAPVPVAVGTGAPEPLTDPGPNTLTLPPGYTAVSYLSWRNTVTDVHESRVVEAERIVIGPPAAEPTTLDLKVDAGTTGVVRVTAWQQPPPPS